MPRCSFKLSVLLATVGALACQQYPFVYQTNQRVGGRKYEVQVETEGKTDILFVIDNSGSMAEEQQKLKENVGRFIEILTRSVNDYQVGVISTDVFRVPQTAQCDPCCDLDTDGDGLPDWSNCDAGRLIAADGRTRLFKRPPTTDPASVAAAQAELVEGVKATVTSLGTVGNAVEVSLEAVRRALDPQGDVAVRALNRGFLRPDADLALIFLTDEDDCSFPASWYGQPGRDDADCYIDPDATPISDYVDFLTQLKGDVRRVRAAAIIGAVPSTDPSRVLGFTSAGCFTIDDTSSPDVGQASAACGCWSARYLPDRRPARDGDFYCNYLADPPYSQLTSRVPDLGNDQGGCISLPGSRYMQFLTELRTRRDAVGVTKGVLVDSICRANYGETLEQIALEVVLNNCFELKEPPAEGLDGVVMLRNGRELARVERNSPSAGWSYDATLNRICLEGGVIKEVGDVFEISVVSETRGFGD